MGGENASLINVYVLDPKVDLNPNKLSENRLWFLLETLRCLDDKLRDKGSKLFVCMGNPETVIPPLVKVNKAGFLTYERQTEPHNVARDRKIKDALQNESVEVEAVLGHTLFNPDHLLKLNGGKPTLNMTGFQTLVSKAGAPKKPKETPDSLPPFPKSIQSPGVKVFDDVPSLTDFKDLGFDEKNKTCVINAGEDSAIKTMEAFLKQTNRVLSFEKPQTNPTSLEPDTTALSPFMSNGSLSCRLFYWKLMDVYAGAKKTLSSSRIPRRPVALEGDVTPDRILDAQLWTDGRESYLPANTMERTHRGQRGQKNVGQVGERQDRVPCGGRRDESADDAGLDAPLGATPGGLLPHQR